MAWPITAATATILAASMALLFWPGVVGQSMKYLPITLIATLSASLAMALIFVPVLASLFGKRAADSGRLTRGLAVAESGDLNSIDRFAGRYIRLLRVAIDNPVKVILIAAIVLITVYGGYGKFGHGVEFFPEVEPENEWRRRYFADGYRCQQQYRSH